MSNERRLKEGTSAFYIYDEKITFSSEDPFIKWLREEGFEYESFGHGNGPHALYVNINSKVYTRGMAGVGLASVVGNHAIHIDEFKQIYFIFKKYEGLAMGYYSWEQQRKLDEYLKNKDAIEAENKRKREERDAAYFGADPSFEEYCKDLKTALLDDSWYKEHYTEEEIESEIEYFEKDVRHSFEREEHPNSVAAKWWIITF